MGPKIYKNLIDEKGEIADKWVIAKINIINFAETTGYPYGKNANRSLRQTTHKKPLKIYQMPKYEMQNSKYL